MRNTLDRFNHWSTVFLVVFGLTLLANDIFGQISPLKISRAVTRLKNCDIYYLKLSKSQKEAKLNKVASEMALKRRYNERLYIFSYAGKRAQLHEALNNLEEIIRYLSQKADFNANRVVLIDGGSRQAAVTEFYFVPPGAVHQLRHQPSL